MPANSLVRPDVADSLARDGYFVAEDFLARADVDRLLDAFHSLDSATHHGAWNVSMYSSDPAYREAVDRAVKDVVTPRVASLLPGYRLCFCNFLVKEPARDERGAVQIHQDPSFVDERRHDTLGIWIPLVDTDSVNGAIAVLPGSHRWNDGPRGFGGVPTPYLDLLPAFVEHAQTLPMRAGSALVFYQKLFHGSAANRGTATRISTAILLAPNDAQLHCFHANPALPGKLEVFAVDDDFFIRYIYATRPEGVPRVAVVDRWHDEIERAQIVACSTAHER